MVMRSDSFPAGGALVGRPHNARGSDMAKKTPAPASHAEAVGGAAHAAMRQLSATGVQSVHVDPALSFAELQDEGPTARDPRTYPGKGSGK